MKTLITLGFLFVWLPCAAWAQEPGPAPGTTLFLNATGSVPVQPDQLSAALAAQATIGSAAEAQRRVNALMAAGMEAARAVPGVEARAAGYEVWPTDDKRSTWTAQQMLELHSADGPALLDLVGKLQGKGFTVQTLAWGLSPAAQRKAASEATGVALRAMQDQAGQAAGALGLHVAAIRTVHLQPRPAAPIGLMMGRVAAAVPQATQSTENVTAEVTAEVVLQR